MTEFWQIALMVVLIALCVHFIIYTNRHSFVRIIDPHKDFVVRYPRILLWLAVVFFAILGCLLTLSLIWQTFDGIALVLMIVLGICGVPLILLALVWNIKVYDEFIITRSMLGVKKQIYYKDIQQAVVTKNLFFMKTTIKNYRFHSSVVYREEFLLRLRENNVEIERFF